MKGGVSGLVSGGLLQPLQVIKTSMQVSPIEDKNSTPKTTKPMHKSSNCMSFR